MSIDGQPTTGPDAAGAPAAASTPAHRRAVILGGNRIPFARSGGAYAKSSNQDMLTAALDGLIARGEARPARTGSDALADITRAVSPVSTRQLLDDSRGRW